MDHLENSTTSTPDPEPIPPNAEPTDTQPTQKVDTAPPPKKRKPLSTEALEKLKTARELAAAANRKKKQERQAVLQATYNPVVVVEQSDSDPEQLEGPPGVVFVRRKRAKPQPEKSAEQLQQDVMYARMFGI